jgi:hypothetical protein
MSFAQPVAERSETTDARPPGGGPAAPATDSPIFRIPIDGAPNVPERFGVPSALAAGQVDVVDLGGVVEHMGRRWRARKEVVHLHSEHLMAQRLGPRAAVQQLGETCYVVAQPERTRFEAQALLFRCLKEILERFVGEAQPDDLRLREVTFVTSAEIHGRPVELDDALAAAIDVDYAAEAGSPTLAETTRFVASDGRTVRVSCVLEPVVHLANSTRIGFRLARRVLDVGADRPLSAQELQNLSRADIARVDYATISRGLDRLHAEAGEAKLPTLIVPVSCATLANERTRAGLVALLDQARAEVRHGLVCEICDIDGMAHEALAEDVSRVRPYCVRLLAFVADPRPPAFHALKGLGLDGVSVECPPNLGDAEFVGWTRQTAKAAHAAAGALFLYRVQSIQRGALASLAGASHVSMAPAVYV